MNERPIFMLDTDIVSYLAKGVSPAADRRFRALHPSSSCISVVTYAELLMGLHKAPPSHRAHGVAGRFLNATKTLDWDRDAADVFADWYERLRRRGEPIQDRDLMIAAHAISLGLILVTNNTRHFGRLAPGLKVENWTGDGGELVR